MPDAAFPNNAGGRAHLTGSHAPTPPIRRYPPSPHLSGLIRNFWVPVWNLPDGEVQTQRVLQYPVCVIVVTGDYARCYGPTSGLSTVDLSGRGWAVGVMLQPAAGRIMLQRSVANITDGHLALDKVPAINGASLRDQIRVTMTNDPSNETNHRAAATLFEDALQTLLPIDEEGERVNQLVEMVETNPAIMRVSQLAEETGMHERALQRLTSDRLGLSPKCLIQRRRLHDAVAQIKTGEVSLTDLAYTLGYADQAHFTRDFARVTGTTPGEYLGYQR